MEENILAVLRSMPNNKTPGNDGLSKEFYETFWDEIKDVFLTSVKEAKEIGSLSVSQTQAIMKLLENKNWKPMKPISSLNVDTHKKFQSFCREI